MFHIRVGHASVVYTGDYNMTPDRHLGAAWIDKVRPDVLITESTYATTIRDSKRARERDFLKKVHECVSQNGKVCAFGTDGATGVGHGGGHRRPSGVP